MSDTFHLMSESFTELQAAYAEAAKKEVAEGNTKLATQLSKNAHCLNFAIKAYYTAEIEFCMALMYEFGQHPVLNTLVPSAAPQEGDTAPAMVGKYAYIQVLHQLAALDILVNTFVWHMADQCMTVCPGTERPKAGEAPPTVLEARAHMYIEDDKERLKVSRLYASIKKRYAYLRDTCGSDCKKAPVLHAKATAVETSQSSWLLKDDELLTQYHAVHACVLSNPWDVDVLGRIKGMKALMANSMDSEMRKLFHVSTEGILSDLEADMSCAYAEYEGVDLEVYRIQMMKAALQVSLRADRLDLATGFLELAEKNNFTDSVLKDKDVSIMMQSVKAHKSLPLTGDENPASGEVSAAAALDAITVKMTPEQEASEALAMQSKEEGNAFMGQITVVVLQNQVKGVDGTNKDEDTLAAEVKTLAQKAVACYTRGTDAVKMLPGTTSQCLLTAHLYGNRSYAQWHLKEYRQGLTDAHAAVTAHPGFVKAYYRAGLCARELKEYSHALRMLRMGIVQEREQNPEMNRSDSKLEQLMSEVIKEEPLNVPEEGTDSGSAGTLAATGAGKAAGAASVMLAVGNKKDDGSSSKGKKKDSASPQQQEQAGGVAASAIYYQPDAAIPPALLPHLQLVSILEDPIDLDLPKVMTQEEHTKLVVRASVASIIKRYYLCHGANGHEKDDVASRQDLAKASLAYCKNLGTSALSKTQRKKIERMIEQATTHLVAAIAGEDGDASGATWCKAFFQDCMFVPDDIVDAALSAQLVEYQHAVASKSKKNKELENQNKKDRKKLQDQAKSLEKAKKTLVDITKKEEEVDSQLKEFHEAGSKGAEAEGGSSLDTDPTVVAKREQLRELKELTEAQEKEAAKEEAETEAAVAALQIEAAELKEKVKAAQANHAARLKVISARKAELEELRRRKEEADNLLTEQRAQEAKEAQEGVKMQADKDRKKAEQLKKLQMKEEARKQAKADKHAAFAAQQAAASPTPSGGGGSGGAVAPGKSPAVQGQPMTLAELESGFGPEKTKTTYTDPSPPSSIVRSPVAVMPVSDGMWTVSADSSSNPALTLSSALPPQPPLVAGGGFTVSSMVHPPPTSSSITGGAVNPPQYGSASNSLSKPPAGLGASPPMGSINRQQQRLDGGAKPFTPDVSAKPFNPTPPLSGGGLMSGIALPLWGAPPPPPPPPLPPALPSTLMLATTSAEPVMMKATVTSNKKQEEKPKKKVSSKSKFFRSGTILSSMWDESTAEELEDEYPGVEFDVHKPKMGKKASITIMATSQVMLREVVETLQGVVQEALALDEEVYRELPDGGSEVVSTIAAPTHLGSIPTSLVINQSQSPPRNTLLMTSATPPSTLGAQPKAPGSGTSPTQAAVPSPFSMFGSGDDMLGTGGSAIGLGGADVWGGSATGSAFGGGSAGLGASLPTAESIPTQDWLQSALAGSGSNADVIDQTHWLRGVYAEDED